MRKRISREFTLIILAVLLVASVIYYLVFSNILLKNTQDTMYYTLRILDASLDIEPGQDLSSLDLKEVLAEENSRFTVIGTDGTVYLDTGTDAKKLENHLEREEVQEALAGGTGETVRYSDTMKQYMLYVAIKARSGKLIYRLSIPYHGLSEYSGTILPMILAAFGISLVIAFLFAKYLSHSITAPLQEISTELDHFKDQLPVSFREYSDPELRNIVMTTQAMTDTIGRSLAQLEKDKRIREEFFSNASHELKTPLTSIRGYMELLESGVVSDPAQVRDFYRRILKETANMTQLIQDILTISRLESEEAQAEYQSFDLAAVTEDAVSDLMPLAEESGVTISCEAAPGPIWFAERHYRQILTNLLSNAIKYNRPPGKVYLSCAADGEALRIIVEDTGVGISEADQERVFERFYRVDQGRSKKVGGTGLGLAIVKHIVQFHGGRIDLTSRLGVGTQITVTLPLGSPEKQ